MRTIFKTSSSRWSRFVWPNVFEALRKRGAIMAIQKIKATMVFNSPSTSLAKPLSMTLLKTEVFNNNTTATIIRFVTALSFSASSWEKPKWRTEIPFGRKSASTKLKNHQYAAILNDHCQNSAGFRTKKKPNSWHTAKNHNVDGKAIIAVNKSAIGVCHWLSERSVLISLLMVAKRCLISVLNLKIIPPISTKIATNMSK